MIISFRECGHQQSSKMSGVNTTKREVILIFVMSCFLMWKGVFQSMPAILGPTHISNDAAFVHPRSKPMPSKKDSSRPLTMTMTKPLKHRKESTKKTAMCTIVLDEEAYLDEFVDFHFALGFDKFFIFDNSDKFEMKQWGKLKGDHVDMIHFPGDAMQMRAYDECLKLLKPSNDAAAAAAAGNSTTSSAGVYSGVFEWVAFLDADEFLVLKQHDHVADMLGEYCERGGLAVNLYNFTQSNWNARLPQPVTRRFVYRSLPSPDPRVKTIARVDDILVNAGTHENETNGNPHNLLVLKDDSTMKDTNGKTITHPHSPNGPVDVVVIHHYGFKSEKELVEKRRKSLKKSNYTNAGYNETTRIAEESLALGLASDRLPNDLSERKEELVFDDSAWQLLKKMIPAYDLFDIIGAHTTIAGKETKI